jgi:hypothetical protein
MVITICLLRVPVVDFGVASGGHDARGAKAHGAGRRRVAGEVHGGGGADGEGSEVKRLHLEGRLRGAKRVRVGGEQGAEKARKADGQPSILLLRLIISVESNQKLSGTLRRADGRDRLGSDFPLILRSREQRLNDATPNTH